MHEDQDTCRICSAPAEPGQPLFHPCKCSGTIRYIHQECLKEWLAHSKRKACDVCKHPYSFTKVYSKDMPDRLPILLIMRQVSQQIASGILLILRAALVATVWLAALPWVTIKTWRLYFALGNSAAWWISALQRPPDPDTYGRPLTNTTASNVTSPIPEAQQLEPASLFSHPLYKTISSDIFAGQIIASIIVLTFVAVFLLREWITQNARPGVFEEGELQPEAPAAEGLPQNVEPQPVQQLAPPPVALPPTPPPVAAAPVPNQAGPARNGRDHPQPQDATVPSRVKKPRTRESQPTSEDGQGGSPSQDEKGKQKASIRERRRARPKLPRVYQTTEGHNVDQYNPATFSASRHKSYQQHQQSIHFRPKTERDGHVAGSSSDLPRSEFTFQAPGPTFPARPLAPGDVPPIAALPFSITAKGKETVPRSPVSSPPHRSDTDDDVRERTPTGRSPPLPNNFSFSIPTTSQVAGPSTIPVLRRPPLPAVTLPPSPLPSNASPGNLPSIVAPSPLASPSLATYCPPEELDTDPGQPGYFVEKYVRTLKPETFVDPNEMDEEHRRYFRNPEEADDEEVAEDEDEDELELDVDGEDDSQGTAADADAMNEEDAYVDVADDEQDDDDEWTDEDAVQLEGEEEDADDEEEDEDEDEDEGNLQLQAANADAQPDVADFDGPIVLERRLVRADIDQPLAADAQFQDELDAEANIEDDMDGALEAIGLRGPMVGVLQNAILMTVILDATIGLGILLPFTIGKSTALLSLNPRRAMQLLNLPLRLIRFITDPLVDTALLVGQHAVMPLLTKLSHVAMESGLRGIASVAGKDYADQFANITATAYGHAAELASQVIDYVAPAAPSPSESTQSTATYLYRVLEEDTMIMRLAEPVFAPIGKNVRELSEEGKTTWIKCATGDTPNDRAFAVLLGYAVVGLLLAIYLNILTIGSMRSAGRAVRHAVRQQLLVVKVAAFIIVELVIFPLGCGVMLDICTVWLFPRGSLGSRAAFLLHAPFTAVFDHWLLGTMFMYQFAVLLSGCRAIMRPGAMWFIKDPQDQNFHPIRDILERPTFVQIRKLVLSAMMYALVVASGVATVAGILRVFSRTIMPFRWKIREPLSEVPIDLILLQWVLPHTIESFRPRRTIRKIGTAVWKYLASRLRLSSYMFGGRYPSEEFSPKEYTWRALLVVNGAQLDDSEVVHDGTFRRVPNNDNIALVKDTPATAEVREDGTPVDEEARKLIDAQNAEAQKAKRQVKKDYTVVYIPPNVKHRVLLFLLGLWVACSIMLASILAAPILLGRAFFRMFTHIDIHDGYSFIVGFYLLWGCYLFGSAIDRLDKRRQRRWVESEERGNWMLYAIKRGLLWSAQALYMIATLGFVIPTLVGLVFELYIVLPIRHAANPLMEPRIRIVDMWALGLLYSRIILRTLSLQQQPQNDGLLRGIDRMQRHGWVHMNPMRATIEVIAPLTAGFLGMAVIPAAALWCLTQIVQLPIDENFLFLHVYPGIFTAAGLAHAAFAFSKVTSTWSQTIRDKEFVVEMRLQNLDAMAAKIEPTPADEELPDQVALE